MGFQDQLSTWAQIATPEPTSTPVPTVPPFPRVPALDQNGIIQLIIGLLVVTVIVIICVAVLVRSNPALLADLISPNMLHIITVIFAMFTAAILALQGILTGEIVANLLSGIVGYVLGSLKAREK